VSEDIETPSTTSDETWSNGASENGSDNRTPAVSDAYFDLEAAELGTPDGVQLPPEPAPFETSSSASLELSELDAIEGAALLEEDLQIEFPDPSIPLPDSTESSNNGSTAAIAEPTADVLTAEDAYAFAPASVEPPSEPPLPPETADGPQGRRRDPNEMEFWDHLDELRERIFKILLFAVLGMSACWAFRTQVLNVLQAPLMVQQRFLIVGPPNDPAGVKNATSVADALRRIEREHHLFVTYADDEKTHNKERYLWQAAGVNPQREKPAMESTPHLPPLPDISTSPRRPGSPADEVASLRKQMRQLQNFVRQLHQFLVDSQTQKKPTRPWYRERWGEAEQVLRYASENKAYTLTDDFNFSLQRKKVELVALYSGDPALGGEKSLMLKPFSPSLFGWFLINVEVSLLAGLIVAAPFILYQIWAFVVPALTLTEKRYAIRVIPFSILLFAAGVVFGFYALPVAVKFLVSFTPQHAERLLDFKLYFGFLLKICLGLGLCFQLPLVMLFLAAIGLVSPSFLTSHWRHAVVLMFVIAAIITPTWDPVNMSIVASPLIVLYFLSILLVKWQVRKKQKVEEASERME
jgi:sec-independent protein translocase protein TatC